MKHVARVAHGSALPCNANGGPAGSSAARTQAAA